MLRVYSGYGVAGASTPARSLTQCLDCDGVADGLVADSASLTNIFTGGGSISGWIKPRSDGANNAGRILDKAPLGVGWFVYVGGESGGNVDLRFDHTFAGGQRLRQEYVMSLNAWTHFLLTYDKGSTANRATLYINGSSVTFSASLTPSGTATNDSGLAMGVGNVATVTDRAFDGRLCDLALWDYELSAGNATAIYNSGSRILVDTIDGLTDPIWFLTCDNPGDNISVELVDEIGTENAAADTGNPTIVTDSP